MGRYTVQLVGESHYQEHIKPLRSGERVELLAEPENKFDPEAVKCVSAAGNTIGYLAREDWAYRAFHDGTKMLGCIKAIVGGTKGKPSRGVILEVFTAKDADEANLIRSEKLAQNKGCFGFLTF